MTRRIVREFEESLLHLEDSVAFPQFHIDQVRILELGGYGRDGNMVGLDVKAMRPQKKAVSTKHLTYLEGLGPVCLGHPLKIVLKVQDERRSRPQMDLFVPQIDATIEPVKADNTQRHIDIIIGAVGYYARRTFSNARR